jgi:hypothetical protein
MVDEAKLNQFIGQMLGSPRRLERPLPPEQAIVFAEPYSPVYLQDGFEEEKSGAPEAGIHRAREQCR